MWRKTDWANIYSAGPPSAVSRADIDRIFERDDLVDAVVSYLEYMWSLNTFVEASIVGPRGAGKTTLALALAYELERKGYRVYVGLAVPDMGRPCGTVPCDVVIFDDPAAYFHSYRTLSRESALMAQMSVIARETLARRAVIAVAPSMRDLVRYMRHRLRIQLLDQQDQMWMWGRPVCRGSRAIVYYSLADEENVAVQRAWCLDLQRWRAEGTHGVGTPWFEEKYRALMEARTKRQDALMRELQEATPVSIFEAWLRQYEGAKAADLDELYMNYVEWVRAQGLKPTSKNHFSMMLEKAGCRKAKKTVDLAGCT